MSLIFGHWVVLLPRIIEYNATSDSFAGLQPSGFLALMKIPGVNGSLLKQIILKSEKNFLMSSNS